MRDSILGIWDVLSLHLAVILIHYLSQNHCAFSYLKKKTLKDITDQGTKDFVRV